MPDSVIFLSYSRTDSELASVLGAALTENGYHFWQDKNDIRGGSEWREQVGEAITNCSALLLCLSPAACASDYVKKEVYFAIRRKKPIVPVKLISSSIELPHCLELELGHLQFLCWPEDGVDAISQAIAACQGKSSNPAPEDPLRKLARSLLESDSSTLKSLGTDLIAFGRLSEADRNMAALNAGRIVARAVAYLANLFSIASKSTESAIDSIFEAARSEGLLYPAICSDVRMVCDIANKVNINGSLYVGAASDNFAAIPTDLEPCKAAVVRIVGALANAAQRRSHLPESLDGQLEVISGKQIVGGQLQQMFLVGQRTFGTTVMPDFSVMEQLHQRNPDIYQALVETSTGVCVGYTSIIPLDQSSFERTIRPDFNGADIRTDDIQLMDTPGFYFLHLSSIVIDPAYRDLSLAYKMLYTAYSNYLARLAERDIFIVAVSADAVTPNGRRICKALGLKLVVERSESSALYWGYLLPPELRLSSKQGLLLLRNYNSTYNEFREFLPKCQP